MNKPVRIQKYISECGIASRRKAEEFIAAGIVTVNGRRAKLGDTCIPGRDRVVIDGNELKEKKKPEKIYVMINKPRGYVTTLSDEQGRRCVAELVADLGVRLFPVGRLDRDSEGMLLMTNDGEFANYVMHPKNKVGKKYYVSVRPQATQAQLDKLATGVTLDDGFMTGEAKVKELSAEGDKSTLEITIFEGKNRQIRRMCAAVGLEVARLKRISIGNLSLGKLSLGKWRKLTKPEVQLILKDVTQ